MLVEVGEVKEDEEDADVSVSEEEPVPEEEVETWEGVSEMGNEEGCGSESELFWIMPLSSMSGVI